MEPSASTEQPPTRNESFLGNFLCGETGSIRMPSRHDLGRTSVLGSIHHLIFGFEGKMPSALDDTRNFKLNPNIS